jgi:aurora kinase
MSKAIHGIMCPRQLQTHLELNKFQFLRAIGHGCASTVFEAKHIPSGIRCVLKVCLKERLYPEAERRIRREIQIHSTLRHPYILTFYASFEDVSAFYFVLEFVENGDLLRYIRNKYQGTMPIPEFTKHVLLPLMHGIAHLHEHNIIHRDIKPENILVDTSGNIRLCDFGFSINSYEERPKSFLGTLEYMAPEIILQKKELYSDRMDIWALGVLTYECLTGVSPFYRTTEQEITSAIVNASYTISPKFTPEIVDFLKRTLHPDPQQRDSIKDLIRHPMFSSDKPTLRRSISF